jgi:hypothetical protein
MKLFWATTDDHDEDWFIIASSSEEAAKLHETMEGYDSGDAEAEEILEIPQNIPAEKGWPSEELLIAVGAKFLFNDQSRVVEIGGRTFCEGLLQSTLNTVIDNVSVQRGEKRLNRTKRHISH